MRMGNIVNKRWLQGFYSKSEKDDSKSSEFSVADEPSADENESESGSTL